METAVKRLYEGMFLVDSALAAQDWQKVNDEVQRVLSRAEAEVVSMRKWDDRRLCHEIKGALRGTYILVYFNCETDKVNGIERDVQLSELLLRSLILRTERMSEDDLQKPTPLEAMQQEADEAAARKEAAIAEKEAASAAAMAAEDTAAEDKADDAVAVDSESGDSPADQDETV